MAIEPRDHTSMTAEHLQLLLDEAAPNEIIDIPEGRLTGSFVIDRPVILRGVGAEETVIEGDGTGPVFSIEADDGTVRLEQMSITQGRASFGGGVYNRDGVYTGSDNNSATVQGTYERGV
ncbi:MAG: hypothetical protein AAFV29_10175, partial [Myxococcota bacterium]